MEDPVGMQLDKEIDSLQAQSKHSNCLPPAFVDLADMTSHFSQSTKKASGRRDYLLTAF
jgi:hypothetical protein